MLLFSEDRAFGVHIHPTGPYLLFTFQLIIDGVEIGDSEPASIYNALLELENVARILDFKAPDKWTRSGLKKLVREHGKEPIFGQLSEAQDGWRNLQFISGERVHLVAQKHDHKDRIYGASVDEEEYFGIVHALRAYWERRNPRRIG